MQPGHWIVITLIAAWAAVVLAAMWHANQKAWRRHRERLAMIEKGIPLPPEPTVSHWRALRGPEGTHARGEERRLLEFIRFVGILTVAGGIGLYFLLTILDQWRAGVGLGGTAVLVGLALILMTVRALRVQRHPRDLTEE